MSYLLPPTKPHPRLFITPARIDILRTQVETDPVSKRMFALIRRTSDAMLDAPPQKPDVDVIGTLLLVCRNVAKRVMFTSFTALITGDARYARRAIQEMEAVAGFESWGRKHFLDVGEMTFGMAVGYDWLYDHLTPEQRDAIATAIIEKGLKLSLLDDRINWWVNVPINWNQVCHAGMTAGALVVAEREPELAARIVGRTLEKVPLAGATYAPDGAHPEGPMYWSYGTAFHCMIIAMLESALGDDGGLANAPGFLASANYIRQVTSPTGRFFNYSDAPEGRVFDTTLFWLARQLDEPELLHFDLAALETEAVEAQVTTHIDQGRLLPLALLDWKPEFSRRLMDGASQPRHWMARGEVPVGIHRSAWNDPQAAYLAIKGGCASVNHGHMDGGVFVLEAGGVRWAADLGVQEYGSITRHGLNMWKMDQGSDRWKVLRLNSDGHSILRFNEAPQLVGGTSFIVRFQADGDLPHTVVDLSAVYADQAARVWRGVALRENGQFLLQDEWTAGQGAVDVRWQMVTHADMDLSAAPERLTLYQDGKEFVLRLLEPADAWIEILDLSAPAHVYDAPNPGARMIVLHTRSEAGQPGCIRWVGALGSAATVMAVPPVRLPLAQWSAALAKPPAIAVSMVSTWE